MCRALTKWCDPAEFIGDGVALSRKELAATRTMEPGLARPAHRVVVDIEVVAPLGGIRRRYWALVTSFARMAKLGAITWPAVGAIDDYQRDSESVTD